MSNPSQEKLCHSFNARSASETTDTTPKKEKLYPVSFRVTASEKERLKHAAGKSSVSGYVRQRALGDLEHIRPKQYRKKQKEPSINAVEIARLLGMFGQSEIATSMLALSLAAAQGNLDVTDEVEDKIENACYEIETIKIMLVMALGIIPE